MDLSTRWSRGSHRGCRPPPGLPRPCPESPGLLENGKGPGREAQRTWRTGRFGTGREPTCYRTNLAPQSGFPSLNQTSEERVGGAGSMRDRVLLADRHLRERLRRAVRDEDRIEAEPGPPARGLRDCPLTRTMEDLVRPGGPQEEHGLERRSSRPGAREKFQNPSAAEPLVYVRRVHARKAAERIDEEPGVVDEIIAADLVVEDGCGEPHDFLQPIRLDLRIAPVLMDQPHPGLEELRGDLAELALVRRHERDHVYRPRDSMSLTFAMTPSAAFPIVSR